MNIIIVGAGSVGFTAAEVLCRVHDVLIIESNKQRADTAKSLLNVSVLQEDGASPSVIESAITRHQADAIMCTTGRDDLNLFVAMYSKKVKPGIRAIPRVRSPDYCTPKVGECVDQILSPEMSLADKIATMATLENCVDYESIESMKMGLATFAVTEGHEDIVGSIVINLRIPAQTSIVAIYRGEDVILSCETTELHPGDKIVVLGSPDGLSEFNSMMGIQRKANEVIVVGGGVAGEYTAKILEGNKKYVKLFEIDSERCQRLSRSVNTVIIIHGSGVDPHLLRSESVGRADVLVALTGVDETNLLACLMASKLGVPKMIARYSTVEYEGIFDFTGVPTTVGFHRVIANDVTKTLISDEQAILRMRRAGELFFSVKVDARSKVKGVHFGDLRLPDGVRIACIVRGREAVYPRMDTQFQADDKVLVFTYNAKMGQVERLFGTPIDIDVRRP